MRAVREVGQEQQRDRRHGRAMFRPAPRGERARPPETNSHQRRGGTSRNTANIVALGNQNSDVGSVGALKANPIFAPM